MGWKEIPDLVCVGLLIYAFAAVSRPRANVVSRVWLAGWITIEIHYFATVFWNPATRWGVIAAIISEAALTWAACLFMWAMIPHRKMLGSRLILIGMLFANTLYLACLAYDSTPRWLLTVSACLFAIIPLSVALATRRALNHPPRWIVAGLYCALSPTLLIIQSHGTDSPWLVVAPLTVAYAGCCIYFWHAYRRVSAGTIIALSGFVLWTSVFSISILGPRLIHGFHVDDEVWNMPKYLVAVGMILLLLEDQLTQNRHMALHDELTGLPNRRLFLDCLARSLERARRGRLQMAILAIDLDGFKHVNDTLGHHVGDAVLQEVAAVFATRVRRSDILARTGGDEFSVILEAPAGLHEAELLSCALTNLLQNPIHIGEHPHIISASIGIAVYPDDAADIQSLCVAADQRMYEAKRTARIEV